MRHARECAWVVCWCVLICMHVLFFFYHTPLCSLYNLSLCVPLLCVSVCACLHMRRCMRPCGATMNAASMSGGPSPGPFALSTQWTTCQPAGRGSKAARSGQWEGQRWQTASLASQHNLGGEDWQLSLAHTLVLTLASGGENKQWTHTTAHYWVLFDILFHVVLKKISRQMVVCWLFTHTDEMDQAMVNFSKATKLNFNLKPRP